jgi:ribosomal protein L22
MADEKKTTGGKAADSEAKATARKPTAKKPAAKKETAAKAPAKKQAAAKKPAAKKETAAKAPAKKETAAKAPAKKEPAKETKPKPRAKPREEAPMRPVVRASARYVRVAPRKARLVADQVRGLPIDRARALLQFSPRSVALDIQKLIDSAASNAENNHELVADDMLISEITVDEGPTLRRYRPRALGRATRINKRTSHISVALTPED